MLSIDNNVITIQSFSDIQSYQLLPSPVWIFDIDDYCFWWGNSKALEYWDLGSLDQLTSKDLSDDDEGARDRMIQSFNRAKIHGVSRDPWTTFPDGQAKTVILNHRAVLLGEHKHLALIAFVNEEVNMSHEPENLLLAEAMRYTKVAVTCYSMKGQLIIQNPAATALYSEINPNLTENASSCEFVTRFTDTKSGQEALIAVEHRLESQAEHLMNTANGRQIRSLDIRTTRHPLTSEPMILVADYDVSDLHGAIRELEKTKEELRQLAHYDALTGLTTLRMFNETLNLSIESAKRSGQKIAIHFIDLDGFKSVNDQFGHDAGDAVLKEVAERLQLAIRKSDIAGRLGGDEFVIMQSNVKVLEDVTRVAERIIEDVKTPVVYESALMQIGVSIGIAIYPDDGSTSDELLKAADKSMYDVKKSGKNSYQLCS